MHERSLHGRLAPLKSLPAMLLVAVGTVAWGAPPDMGQSCAPVERELAEAQKALKSCGAQLRAAVGERQGCSEELAGTVEKLAGATAATQSCQSARSELCVGTGALAAGIADGKLNTGGVTGCVTPEQQHELSRLLGGWGTATAVLSSLAAFQAGESDLPPHPPAASTTVEKLAARLIAGGRGGPPLFYRRLLVE